jgi:hypothetical protein
MVAVPLMRAEPYAVIGRRNILKATGAQPGPWRWTAREATAHLVSTKANADRLVAAVRELDADDGA